jgi:hypothetical protein
VKTGAEGRNVNQESDLFLSLVHELNQFLGLLLVIIRSFHAMQKGMCNRSRQQRVELRVGKKVL